MKSFSEKSKIVCGHLDVMRIYVISRRHPKILSPSSAFKTFARQKSSKGESFDDLFKKFSATESKSLLKKYLTEEIVQELKDKMTKSFKSTLLDCARSGLIHPDSNVGLYAADPECYKTFASLFDQVICDYHGGFKPNDNHPPSSFGYISSLKNLDPDCKYIKSTRVRCGRSVEGFAFNPKLTENDYRSLEQCIVSALKKLTGEHCGNYEDLCSMKPERQKQLIDDHYLFKAGDRFLKDAHALNFWPVGRGIFMNEPKSFLVWVNEEDHLRIISMQSGGDLAGVYTRLVKGVEQIGKQLKFMHDQRLGFLTSCPTNLGTTLRASVHIALPNIATEKEKLEAAAAKYNLQVRGTSGEHTESVAGVYDVSNRRRLGLTECEAIMEMAKGIEALIKLEEQASKQKKC